MFLFVGHQKCCLYSFQGFAPVRINFFFVPENRTEVFRAHCESYLSGAPQRGLAEYVLKYELLDYVLIKVLLICYQSVSKGRVQE